MKDLLIAVLLVVFLFTWAHAYQPIYPDAKDYNGLNNRSNWQNISYYQKTISAGVSTGTFTDIACDANSCVVATINSAVAQYVVSAVPSESQVVVTLSGVPAADVQVSILVISK